MRCINNIALRLCVLGLILVPVAEAKTCPYTHPNCRCDGTTVTCTNLQTIPTLNTGTDVTVVDTLEFEQGQITTIPENSLPPGLVNIALRENPLTNITENAFNSVLTTLKSLSIRNAKFHRIPSAFVKLTTLETFRLDTIDISDWNSPALQNVANTIQSLYLVVIDLTEWPLWVSGCRSLRSLSIIASTLYAIPDDAFVSLNETLTSLILRYADFSQIPTALSSLGNLTTLDVTGNHLESVNGREGLQQVTTFPWASTLLTLRGGNMFLTSLPDLSTMTSLTRLDLRYNRITEVSSHLLPQDLEILILLENNITMITAASFTNLSRLELLDLGSNPISRISYEAFNDLTSLKTLRLYNTRLKYFPLALYPLSGLKSLDMSLIPTLECPCPIVVIDAHLWFINNSVEVVGVCRNQQTISSYLNFSCPQPTTSTTGAAPVLTHSPVVFGFVFTFVAYICCLRILSCDIVVF